jgi:hypothetical protein
VKPEFTEYYNSNEMNVKLYWAKVYLMFRELTHGNR